MQSKSDSTSDLVAVGAVVAIVLLLWPRGGSTSGNTTPRVARVSVQADAFMFAGASFTSCDALVAALPAGDVIIDGTLGTHAAVVDLQTCLEAAGRRVVVLP